VAKNRDAALAEAIVEREMRYVLGLDLGRKSTYAALCLLALAPEYVRKREAYRLQCDIVLDEYGDTLLAYQQLDRLRRTERPRPAFVIQHLERIPLGTRYHDIARYVRTMVEDERLRERINLCVDAGGVGDVVAEELEHVGLVDFVRVISGHHEGAKNTFYNRVVAKATLVGNLEVAFQNGQIRFNPDVPYAEAFTRELEAFQYHITPAGNETYKTLSGEYDDLISSAALANYLFLDLERYSVEIGSSEDLVGINRDAPFEPMREGEFFRLKDSGEDELF
jgi:hypothetical protein